MFVNNKQCKKFRVTIMNKREGIVNVSDNFKCIYGGEIDVFVPSVYSIHDVCIPVPDIIPVKTIWL